MPTTTKNRRVQTRYSVLADDRARVEFVYPSPNGESYSMPLANLSASGLSFGLREGDTSVALEEGASLPDAVIRIGNCAIKGELLVMHVTTGPDSRYVCGALFYPATDTDLVKLKSAVAGMEVVGTD
jgi:hypothetical protein